jgi:3-hydroxyacyl-CoA dehydrogenase
MIGLDGRIIGFHFYNPPAVQKLAELIPAEKTKKAVVDTSHEIAKRLRKTIIPSNDVAGFIGNGHFMRDILYAAETVINLSKDFGAVEAIYAVNKISQDFLIRPMGIFQLTDYVGVDVCQLIMKVMTTYIEGEVLKCVMIDAMVNSRILGGQYADGSQKDGFLKYERNKPAGIYDLKHGKYVALEPEGWTKAVNEKLGTLPSEWSPWRSLLMDPARTDKLNNYFDALKQTNTLGGELARAYMKKSKQIAEKLVADGVADNPENVNDVMTNGFYHLYGPVNTYME